MISGHPGVDFPYEVIAGNYPPDGPVHLGNAGCRFACRRHPSMLERSLIRVKRRGFTDDVANQLNQYQADLVHSPVRTIWSFWRISIVFRYRLK